MLFNPINISKIATKLNRKKIADMLNPIFNVDEVSPSLFESLQPHKIRIKESKANGGLKKSIRSKNGINMQVIAVSVGRKKQQII